MQKKLNFSSKSHFLTSLHIITNTLILKNPQFFAPGKVLKSHFFKPFFNRYQRSFAKLFTKNPFFTLKFRVHHRIHRHFLRNMGMLHIVTYPCFIIFHTKYNTYTQNAYILYNVYPKLANPEELTILRHRPDVIVNDLLKLIDRTTDAIE